MLGSAVLAATALGHATLLGSKPKAAQVLSGLPVLGLASVLAATEPARRVTAARGGRRSAAAPMCCT
jgi:hypothetical protein